MGIEVTLKSNRLPQVREALLDKVGKALDDIGTDLSDLYRMTVWKRLGFISNSVTVRDVSEWEIEIVVGWRYWVGFYSGFQEFGTIHQGARPVVRPGAHEAEPIFAAYVERAIKKASEA